MTTSEKSSSAGRPIDLQKTIQVFKAIDTILETEGISGLSIERIAKTSVVSKATLYRRFHSLEGLLTAYVETFIQLTLDSPEIIPANALCPNNVESSLTQFGIRLMKLISASRVVTFDNAMIAAGPQFNPLKQVLYRNGPHKAITHIGQYLQSAGIHSPLFDHLQLADMLFHLWRSGFYDQLRFLGHMTLSPEQLEQHIAATTRFFLAGLTNQECE
jgi:AcrR family transcriptional regulator